MGLTSRGWEHTLTILRGSEGREIAAALAPGATDRAERRARMSAEPGAAFNEGSGAESQSPGCGARPSCCIMPCRSATVQSR